MRPSRSLHPCLAVLLAVSFALPARAAWHSLEEIPVESPVYRLVDDLASSYPLSQGMLLTRPWTRADLGRFLDQLAADLPAATRDPAFVRLSRELTPGGGSAGLEPALSSEDEDLSFELSPYARAAYAEDRSRDALTRDFRAGLQASLAYGEDALLFADGYAGTITPGGHGTPDGEGSFRARSTDLTAWADRATATWARRGFLVRAGHDWLRWGPGTSGTLALSDNAPAFDVLEARLRVVGGAQLAWFVAALDPAAQTYLAGHRLEMRAGPSVELSLSELARFDGTGTALLGLVPVMPFAFLERRVRGASALSPDSLERLGRANVMYAADFSWTWRPGMRFYGELMVDDATLHNTRPLAAGYQLGAHLRRVLAGSVWTLRGEYTRVSAYTYSVSHHHDFTHAGFATGFSLGPDVDQIAGRFEWRRGPAWTIGLEGSVTRKGSNELGQAWLPGQPVPQHQVLMAILDRDLRYGVTADWSPSPTVSLGATAGLADVTARGHVTGDDADGAYGNARATFRW